MKIRPVTKATALGLIAKHMASIRMEETQGLEKKQKELIEFWSQHPNNFIFGTDSDSTPVYLTKDEKDSRDPIKPFPHYEYLKDYIGRLHDERFVFVDKARQLLFSTATLAYANWQCLFLPGRRWLLSRSKEDDAKEMLKDKIRVPVRHMPKWFQKWARVSGKPEIRVDFRQSDSYILACTQNVADNSARGGSASGFVLDEAAFQEMFGSILGAAEPMCDKFIGISTPPDSFNPGAEEFYKLVDDTADVEQTVRGQANVLFKIDGYQVERTRRSFCVIRADYWCIPRTPEWVMERRISLGTRRFQREYERNRSIGGESAFFPEFNTESHVRKIAGLLPDVVYRGFDFGRRHPACVWLQHSPRSNRVWFLREIVLSDIDVYSFRDLVRYLSGQIPYTALASVRPRAVKHLEWLEGERDFLGEKMPKHPWFEACQFIDFAGHEATIDRSGILETEHEHKTYADVFRAGGVNLSIHYMRVTARVVLMRQLLGARQDGQPGGYFDPACVTLIKAMAGALSYKKGTKDKPAQEEAAAAPKYTDVFDASSYPLPSIVPVDEENVVKVPQEVPQALRGQDYRMEPEQPVPGDSVDTSLLKLWR